MAAISLAFISSIFTAILVCSSALALKHTSGIVAMAFRVAGIAIIAIPCATILVMTGKSPNPFSTLGYGIWIIIIIMAASGVVSWFTFYEAFVYGSQSGVSDAAITAINYTSLAFIMMISIKTRHYSPDWRNWLGAVLIFAGAWLTSLKSG